MHGVQRILPRELAPFFGPTPPKMSAPTLNTGHAQNTTKTVPRQRIGVLGAGGIGSVVGGYLAAAGHDVTLIDPWFEHIDAVQHGGLLIRDADGKETATTPVALHFSDLQSVNECFDMGIVAVNEYDASWAAACLDRYVKPLSEGGVLCCFMNGVNDDKMAKAVAASGGAARVLGAIMTISAAVYDPGVALRTDKNAHCFKVGELEGATDTARARLLAAMLDEAIGPSSVTPNLWGQRWSKLIVNCMNNALAGLTGWKTAACRTHSSTQPVGILLAGEVVRVARAAGKEVEDVMGLSPDAILAAAEGEATALVAVQAQLGAMAAAAGDLSRPSFGQDVLKGRRTEIDGLNGLVSRTGREVGVPTPFCDAITALVTKLGVGFQPDPAHVEPLLTMAQELEGGSWHDKYTAACAAAAATATTAAPPIAPPFAAAAVVAPSRRRLRVAGVGAGYFAQFHYDAWDRLGADAELVAICDSDEAKAVATAAKFGLDTSSVYTDANAMLAAAKPDLFDIVTPPETHLQLVRLACESGIATVICQKPLAPTLKEAAEIVSLAERYSSTTKLVVHENFRFQPWFVELRRLLHEQRAIGVCYSASFRLRPGDGQGDPPAYVARQPYFKHMDRFIIHETGIHFIDVFRFLLGAEVADVYADLTRLNSAIAGEDAGTVIFGIAPPPATNSSACVICPRTGARAVLDCNRLVDHDAEDCRLTMGEMLLEGSEGVLRLDGSGRIFLRRRASAARPGVGSAAHEEREVVYAWERGRGFAGDCVHACQQHVTAHVLRGAALANGARDFLRNVAVEEAVYLSAQRCSRVTLAPDVPRLPAVPALSEEGGGGEGCARIRAHLGEGSIWDSRRGQLLWCDILRARIFTLDPSSGATTELDLSAHTQHITTIVPVEGETARVVVGTTEGVALVDLDSGAVTQHPSNGSLLKPFERMNDGKCDPQGRFWVGSVAKTGPGNAPMIPGAAALYRLDGWDEDGGAPPEKVVASASCANGIVWTADGHSMYWIDSATGGVEHFDFNGATGAATGRRKAVADCLCPLQPERAVSWHATGNVVPDGCALDVEGMLWVVLYGGGEVRRFDPRSGALLAVVVLPSAAGVESTSCAFGGTDLDELYITTAHKFWTSEQKTRMPLGGALFKVTREMLAQLGPGIRGCPVSHFKC